MSNFIKKSPFRRDFSPLNDNIANKTAVTKVTLSMESGYSADVNEVYYMGNETATGVIHVFGTIRIWGTYVSGWTNDIGTINRAPQTECLIPLLNATSGIFAGMISIKATGKISIYNSTGATLSNARVAAVIAY